MKGVPEELAEEWEGFDVEVEGNDVQTTTLKVSTGSTEGKQKKKPKQQKKSKEKKERDLSNGGHKQAPANAFASLEAEGVDAETDGNNHLL